MRGSGGFAQERQEMSKTNTFGLFHFSEVNPRPETEIEHITVEKDGEPVKVVPRSAMENYISLGYKITNRAGLLLYDPAGYPYQVARKPDWQTVIVENEEHMKELIRKGYTIEDAEGRVIAVPENPEPDFAKQLRDALDAPVRIKNRDSGEIRTIKRMELHEYNTKYEWGHDMWYEIDQDGNEVKDSWKPAANYGQMAFKPVNPVSEGKGGSDQAGKAPGPVGPFTFRQVNT